MVVATTTWHKPPLARHAAVYEALADILEGATPSALKLALYLYRTCIGGKPEEIDIHCIPLGEKRATPVRNGKPYSPNTRRAALKQLEKFGLVKILKNYGRGIFRIAVQHLGEVRPFIHTHPKFQKLSNQSKNQRQQSKIEQTEGSNPDSAVLFTKDKKGQQSTENVAAVFLNLFEEKENLAKANIKPKNVEPKVATQVQTKTSQSNENLQEKLEILDENKCSAPTTECLNTNSDKIQAIDDVTISRSSEQTGLTSEPPQKLPTKLDSLDHQRISGAEPTITNKAVQLNPETSSFVNPEVAKIVEPVVMPNSKATEIADPDVTEIVEAVAIANSETTEIVEVVAISTSEAVVIANPDVTEIIEVVAIVNSETTEIADPNAIANSQAVAITNPDATQIVEIVMQATGGMNPELRVCVLQYNLEEIQAAVNLLQIRSQTKQISNPSGWIVDCLRGRWWEQTNGFPNSNPANVVSSPASTGSSPVPKNSPSAHTTRITEDYIDPHYMPLKTHQKLFKQFQKLGEEAFVSLGIQQQVYLQWIQRFPQQAKQILSKLSTT
ncbi:MULTISPECIES: hypothetical protein [unclassified Microcoleus]|uniref:hypothetical protein n=1 Tax=unclassified Microcoleus TaxID=2642155 RepID=UPI001D871514|nr:MULTISPECIES: hypothetical protein [unclassified Microcoleus]MCC3505815.1 hypothetical protein [Microcoleus sp. PH2017_19_SFW_U_A]TAG92158.1 MAG: hypothetical protein EAZ19_18780 [Oscillatoriales cyanobacterium]MCC3475434.1 hypothetical protein [Microcoleus sp. PH2017_13_LAR_U_A]MCC3487913.1 hypothetical protein [Microcoleus sp. PH2017_14_LAR_D_A]MCC3498137.1 hypothetical protein [Microcoleus sp. PH2017_15_JOR_U_A]